LVIAVFVGAVAAAASGQVTPAGSQPASKPATAPADEVAVIVNGRPIMESHLNQIVTGGRKMTAEEIAQVRERIKPQMRSLFDYVIGNELIIQAAGEEGIVLTEQEWNDEFEKAFASRLQGRQMSREQAAEVIQNQLGKTLDEYKKDMVNSPAFRTPILQDRIIHQKLADKLKVTDAEVKDFYEQNKVSRYTTKEDHVRARHILFGINDPETRQPMSTEAKQAQRKKAEEMLIEVKKPGADFAALAREHSSCPSGKSSGGDLSYFPRARMVAPFAEAAFATKVGEISGIVETVHGYHIIEVTGRLGPGEVIPFEAVKEQIRSMLETQKPKQVLTQYKQDLMNRAKIVYPPGKEPASRPAPPQRPVMSRPASRPMISPAMRPATSPTSRPAGRLRAPLPPPQTAPAQ